MANGRGDSPDLKGTLGALLRTTLEHAGQLREVVEREAKSTVEQLDQVMQKRRRRDALARLGELVYELAGRGELGDLIDYPEIAETVAAVEALDSALAAPTEEFEVHPEGERRSRGGARWGPRKDAAPSERAPSEREVPVWRPLGSEETGGKRRSSGAGVAFVDDALADDADLAEYMHADDVPSGQRDDSDS